MSAVNILSLFLLERKLNKNMKELGYDNFITISDITREIRKNKSLTKMLEKMVDKYIKLEEKENG